MAARVEQWKQKIPELSGLLESVYDAVQGVTGDVLGERARKVLIGVNQDELIDAVIADVLDIIPVVGDFTNLMRVYDSAKTGTPYEKKRRLASQLVDMVAGVLPDPIGTVLDVITPTNTLLYLEKTGKRFRS